MKKTKAYLKYLCIFVSSFMCLSLIACGNKAKPDNTVKIFLDTIQKQDVKAASAYLDEKPPKITFDNAQQEKVAKLVFTKMKYEILETTVDKDTAIVKAKITAPDLIKINESLMKELLPKILELAFAGNTDKEKPKKMMNDYFTKSISDKNATNIEKEVSIKLEKRENKWVIHNDSNLIDAITGNLHTAFFNLNNQNGQTTIK